MKLLITGAAGQLGKSFTALLKDQEDIEFSFYSRKDLDITSQEEVQAVIAREEPDYVINTAAYTQVDLAEDQPEQAFAINKSGVENLALVCQSLQIPLVHYSTDYVFNGANSGGWKEEGITEPLGVYGASKLAGEQAVINTCDKYFIFRTSWVFSPYGNNFVKTMLRLGSEREELGVVNDQFGKPTSAEEIARVTLEIIKKNSQQWGIYHLAQPEAVSWYQFAEEIFSSAEKAGLILQLKKLGAITTSEFPTKAVRPANSVLQTEKLEKTFAVKIKPWKESLQQTIDALTGD